MKVKFGLHPTPKKKTMSVPEMRRMLGIRKTESYWLVKKQYFVTNLFRGQMRIDIKSFEEWYRHQWHYKKVNGEPPGGAYEGYLIAENVRDILGITIGQAYYIIGKSGNFETTVIAGRVCIRRSDFEKWYPTQTKYFKEDAECPIENIEETYIHSSEIAEILGVCRLTARKRFFLEGGFQKRWICGREYIFREDFNAWLREHGKE